MIAATKCASKRGDVVFDVVRKWRDSKTLSSQLLLDRHRRKLRGCVGSTLMPYPAETSQHLDRDEKFLAPITPAVPDKRVENGCKSTEIVEGVV